MNEIGTNILIGRVPAAEASGAHQLAVGAAGAVCAHGIVGEAQTRPEAVHQLVPLAEEGRHGGRQACRYVTGFNGAEAGVLPVSLQMLNM